MASPDDAWLDDAEGGDYLDALEAGGADSIDAADEDEFLGACSATSAGLQALRGAAPDVGRGRASPVALQAGSRKAREPRRAWRAAHSRSRGVRKESPGVLPGTEPPGLSMQILGQHLNQPAADESEFVRRSCRPLRGRGDRRRHPADRGGGCPARWFEPIPSHAPERS
jgi:hypothetical protein